MDACCSAEANHSGSISRCPSCDHKGRAVGFETPDHLLLAPARQRLILEGSYFFCATASCDVVYFSSIGETFLHADLSVPVTQKATVAPIPVCYCFGFFESDIETELRQTGSETVTQRITEGTRDGRCACETKNPQGACCLGNVAVAVRRVRERLSGGAVPSARA